MRSNLVLNLLKLLNSYQKINYKVKIAGFWSNIGVKCGVSYKTNIFSLCLIKAHNK